jgi:hypothetical protein
MMSFPLLSAFHYTLPEDARQGLSSFLCDGDVWALSERLAPKISPFYTPGKVIVVTMELSRKSRESQNCCQIRAILFFVLLTRYILTWQAFIDVLSWQANNSET